jgi:hypothetical protein
MAQFKYTLPSGKKFTLNAPAGTTQAQADHIFYQQVAAGSLVGFSAGQSLSGTQTQAIQFALSRLDRGTAGVADTVILSIVNGLPSVSGLPNLINVPLQNPISQADIANIGVNGSYASPAIGPLNSNQVQGLLAQIANYVNQPANVMTNSAGVGQYGLTCPQLEMAGYVKPGTYRQFIFDPSPLTDVISAPGIWTGKNGINSATDFLNNPATQNDAMTTLMSQSYDSLTATGTITPPITPSASALSGQVYTQSGLQTVSQLSAVTGISLPSSLSLAGTPLSRLASTSITDVGSLASGALNNPASFTNVSSIASKLENTATGSVAALVTNGSIFGTGPTTQWANSGSIDQLLTGGGFGASFGLPTGTDLTNNIQGLDILGKSSQFASGYANPLTSLSNLGNFNLNTLPSLSNLTSAIPSISSLTSALPSISSLTSALPDLSSLTSILPDLSSLGDFASFTSLGDIGGFGDIGGVFGGGGDSLVSSTQVAAGYTNTVNRSVVDTAFVKILGNPKIPQPSFDYPSPGSQSSAASSDITFAQSQIAQIITLS